MSGSAAQPPAGDAPEPGGMRLQGTAMLAALQFLTLSPPIVKRAFSPKELGTAVGYFPLVGLLIGAILWGVEASFSTLLSSQLSAVIVLICWVALSGALHLDGLLDTFDGIFGGHTPERRLEIMRDHRIGAFALASGVLLILLKYAALGSLAGRGRAVLVAPVLGRWAMTLAMVAYPYARPQGVGRMLKDNVSKGHLSLATVVTAAIVVAVAGWQGVLGLMVTGAAVWAIARFTLARVPGLTGDVYGAICELVEALSLVLTVLLVAL